MDIIASINQKGGVGKTSVAYNLACCLSKTRSVVLIDLDPSGNATKGLIEINQVGNTVVNFMKGDSWIYQAANEFPKLKIIPSDIKLAVYERQIINKSFRESLLFKRIEEQFSNSTVIIDCPPSLRDLTVNAIYAANFFLIPVTYEQDALEGISDLFDLINEIKEGQSFDYRLLRNGYDCRNKITNSYIEEELKEYIKSGDVLKTIIRQNEDINKAKISRMPVTTFSPKSHGAQDFLDLTIEIQEILKND